MVAGSDGLDPAGLKTATGAATGVVRPLDVRQDSTRAAGLLRTGCGGG
ncbi:hypothetical protein [Micromonospora sp. NPDC049645]